MLLLVWVSLVCFGSVGLTDLLAFLLPPLGTLWFTWSGSKQPQAHAVPPKCTDSCKTGFCVVAPGATNDSVSKWPTSGRASKVMQCSGCAEGFSACARLRYLLRYDGKTPRGDSQATQISSGMGHSTGDEIHLIWAARTCPPVDRFLETASRSHPLPTVSPIHTETGGGQLRSLKLCRNLLDKSSPKNNPGPGLALSRM